MVKRVTTMEGTRTMSIADVAEQLGVTGWTVRTWIRQGALPSFKLGRRVLIKVDDVEAYLAANYRPAVRRNGQGEGR